MAFAFAKMGAIGPGLLLVTLSCDTLTFFTFKDDASVVFGRFKFAAAGA